MGVILYKVTVSDAIAVGNAEANMTEFIFMWLEKLGYTHPLHSPVTHVPMGMVIGGCLFALIAEFRRKPMLFRTALHCYVLALVGIPITVFVGYMDWQHFYTGEWNSYIVAKLIMAAMLLLICMVNVVLLRRDPPPGRQIAVGAVVSLALAGVLGYFGGELMVGG
jgi:uncharacterized membrane protein